MASNDLNNILAPCREARGQSQHSAARPENSGVDRVVHAPKAITPGAFSDAMRRSRSGDNRVRTDPLAAGAARRALPMLDDSEGADLNVVPLVPVAEVAIVHRTDRSEQSGRQ